MFRGVFNPLRGLGFKVILRVSSSSNASEQKFSQNRTPGLWFGLVWFAPGVEIGHGDVLRLTGY